MVAAFAEGAGRGAWSLERGEVAERLHELVDSPLRLQQGALNLCGPAALFALWLWRDPEAAVAYATALYEQGWASLGALTIRPSRGLREHRCRAALPPPADWMMMTALRDSANRVLRYPRSGGWGEPMAAMTLPGTLAGWLTATGLYSAVRNDTTLVWRPGRRPTGALAPAPQTDVLALVAAQLFHPADSTPARAAQTVGGLVPNHWAILRAPLAPVEGDRVTVRFWSWGADQVAVLDPARWRRFSFGALLARTWKRPLHPIAPGA